MGPDERLAVRLADAHPADAARVLERAHPQQAAAFLTAVPPRVAGGVVRALSPAAMAACAAALPDAVLSAIVAELPIDAAAATLRCVPRERREPLVRPLPAARGDALRRLLAYAPDTAGALADPRVLAVPDDLTVAEAQKQARASEQRLGYYLYVVTRDQRLVGVLDVNTLMAARPRDTLVSLMHENPERLEAHVPFATLVAHPAWRDFDALPVVDASGTLVGAIRHKTVRQLAASRQHHRGEAVVATVVGLSELYWAGLSAILTSLVPRERREEQANGT